MEHETNPTQTDSEGLELEPSEGQEDVSKTEGLEASSSEAEYFQKLTGREDIKSREDFEKHYEGLKKLVGDQKIAEIRKKAEAYDRLQKEIEKEAEEFLTSEEGQETISDFQGEAIEGRISKLEEELETERFLKSYPEAQPILHAVRAKAQQNDLSLEEAYTNTLEGEKFSLKDLLASKLEVEKSKAEEVTGVRSKSRLAPSDTAEISQLIEKVKQEGTLQAKEKLVEKMLGLS